MFCHHVNKLNAKQSGHVLIILFKKAISYFKLG